MNWRSGALQILFLRMRPGARRRTILASPLAVSGSPPRLLAFTGSLRLSPRKSTCSGSVASRIRSFSPMARFKTALWVSPLISVTSALMTKLK